jgi:hypothetical protein
MKKYPMIVAARGPFYVWPDDHRFKIIDAREPSTPPIVESRSLEDAVALLDVLNQQLPEPFWRS